MAKRFNIYMLDSTPPKLLDVQSVDNSVCLNPFSFISDSHSFFASEKFEFSSRQVRMSAEVIAKYGKNVDAFLLKKWERVFLAFFDLNSSKNVDWSDFYIITRNVRDIYGADSEQMHMAKESLKVLWDEIMSAGDQNKDKKISLDEWIQMLKKADPKNPPKWFTDYRNFIFKLFDVSADDQLDVAEYSDGLKAYGFSMEDAHSAFSHLIPPSDKHVLKHVSAPEFKQLWNDYFFSTNANARGNHLFGVL